MVDPASETPAEPSDPAGLLAAPGKPLTEAARRALEEAAARRQPSRTIVGEHGGPSGPEPTRFGDWERKGLAVDF